MIPESLDVSGLGSCYKKIKEGHIYIQITQKELDFAVINIIAGIYDLTLSLLSLHFLLIIARKLRFEKCNAFSGVSLNISIIFFKD